MDTGVPLKGGNIILLPCTNEGWHAFYCAYIPDPMMDSTPYAYDFARMEEACRRKTADPTRRYFSILRGEEVIGQIYLKHMESGTAELGIALIDDTVKGKGYGSKAISLLQEHAFQNMGLECLTANAVLQNIRSQHVLEKAGFTYLHEDAVFKHYRLNRPGTKDE